MKLKFAFLALTTLILASCFTTTHFDPTSEGHKLSEPVDVEILAKSIRLSLSHYNWTVEEDRPGYMEARFAKSGGIIVADIRIEYSERGYVISYIDSLNLDANLRRSVIHKNYVRWIANLNKGIYTNYVKLVP